MSKLQFQKEMRQNEGYIFSDGTLNLNHLLSKAYDLIVRYGIRTELEKEIMDLFPGVQKGEEIYLKVFYGETEISEEKLTIANEIWNEDVFRLFSGLSPNNYYFGSSEGDGALIGWFKNQEIAS